jgi:hypothetical protein
LFRYALRANEALDEETGIPRGSSAFDPRRPYRISPSVHVLDNLHDCSRVLARIEREPERPDLVDDAQCGELGLYLLHAAGDASIVSRIDPGVEAVLSLFEQPRTSEDAAAIVRAAAGRTEFALDFFQELVHERILVPG